VARSVAVVGGLALAVALILAGSLGLRAARDQLATDRTSAGAPQAIPSGDEARYHELAERLLNFGYGPTGSTTITLLPGALPTDPQVTLPNVNGARLVGTAVRVRGTDRTADIVLDAPGDPQQVANAYEQGFKELGWSGPPNEPGFSGGGGGFQGSVPPVYKFLCKGESAMVSVSVVGRAGLLDDVRISVQPNMASLGGGPCSAQSRGKTSGGSNHLPVLRPPDGAALLLGGGGASSSIGGGPNLSRQSSEATASSAMTSGQLETAFAKQLAAAGWTRVAGRDDGALAWSTWTSNESGWSGSLIVNDTSTKDRHALLLRAEGPGN
jgi:hypothetical protein